MSHTIKKIRLKDGNEYTPVKERILFLKGENIKYKLMTVLELIGGYWKAMATLTILNTGEETTGHGVVAFGKKVEGNELISNTGAELAETKAVGRALAFFGIGIDESIASAEELDSVPEAQAKREPTPSEDKADLAMRELRAIVERKGVTGAVAPVGESGPEAGYLQPGPGSVEPAEIQEAGQDVVEVHQDFLYNLDFTKIPTSANELKTSFDAESRKLFTQCLAIGVNPYCLPGMVTKAKMKKLLACSDRKALEAYVGGTYGRAFVKFFDANYPIQSEEGPAHPATTETPLPVNEEKKVNPIEEIKSDEVAHPDIVEDADSDIEETDNPFASEKLDPKVDYHASGGTGVANKGAGENPNPAPPKGAGGMAPNVDFDKSRSVQPPPPPPAEPKGVKDPDDAEKIRFLSTLQIPPIGNEGNRDFQDIFNFQNDVLEHAGYDWNDLEDTVIRLGLKEKFADGFPGVMISGTEAQIKMVLAGTKRKIK